MHKGDAINIILAAAEANLRKLLGRLCRALDRFDWYVELLATLAGPLPPSSQPPRVRRSLIATLSETTRRQRIEMLEAVKILLFDVGVWLPCHSSLKDAS